MPTIEQDKAIEHGSGNALVSASAGSGKTFVMIERLIRLITKCEVDVDEILAITFTNLAAAEMKEKLVKALTERINSGAENRERLKDQLSRVPGASISTFHSFCLDLIRNRFYELGLDASFSVADDVKSKLLRKRAADRMTARLYEKGDERLLGALAVFVSKRSDSSLVSEIERIFDFFDSEAYPEEEAKKALSLYTPEGVERIKEAFFAHYVRFFSNISATFKAIAADLEKTDNIKITQAVNDLAGLAEGLTYTGNLEALMAVAENISIRLPNFTPNGDFEASVKSRLKKVKEKFDEQIKYLKNPPFDPSGDDLAAMRPVAESLASLSFEFGAEYAAIKREENVLDFADLEHFALELLDREDVKKEIRARYKYVFVDEYQDTNGVQEELLSRISDGNAFMVGDVKQSIYAFRGCDPGIFEEKFRRYEKGEGTAIKLSAGFRSSNAVMAAVNGVFGEIMTEDVCGMNYSLSPLVGGNGTEGIAELHAVTKPERSSAVPHGIYGVKDDAAGSSAAFPEGNLIADLIRKTVGSPLKFKDGTTRPARYGDIVVLVRYMNNFADKLVECLTNNDIPTSCNRKNDAAEYPEIKKLIALLRLIDDPSDDVALISALLGPIGGMTAADLARIRAFSNKKGTSFREAADVFAGSGDGELSEKLGEFFAYLDRLRFLSDYEGAGRILRRATKEKGIDLYYASMSGGRNRVERIDKFITNLAVSGISVADALESLKEGTEDSNLPESGGEDSVRIMTIHASKGLEFPVVILAGLGRIFNHKDARARILLVKRLGFAINTYDLETMTERKNILTEYCKKHMLAGSSVDEERILYVGMTRAEYILYLTETVDDVPKNLTASEIISAPGFSKMISESAVTTVKHGGDDDVLSANKSPRKLVFGSPDAALERRFERNLAFVYPYDTSVAAKSSVTAVLKSEDDVFPVIFKEESGDGKARERGNAYHRFMQLADFNKPLKSQVIGQISEFVARGDMTEEEAALVDPDNIARIMEDGFFRLGAKYYREIPFEVLVPAEAVGGKGDDEVLLQGVIDVMAVTDDEIVIADYKVSSRTPADLLRTYEKQLQLYGYAAGRILKKPVRSLTLFNLLTGEKVPVIK